VRQPVPEIFTRLVALLAVVASAAPLVFDVYARDPAFAKGAELGADVVTLFVATPTLVLSARAAARGSVRGRIVRIGMLAYMFYAYVYYLLGAELNELFPVYVLLVVLPLYALLPLLAPKRLAEIGARFDEDVPARPVALWTFAYAAVIGSVWLTLWYVNLFVHLAGGMGLPPGAVHLVAAVDLSVFCPALIVIGGKLWRVTAPGLALGAAAMVMSAVYPLVLIAGAPFQSSLGVAGAWNTVPLWAGLSAGSFLALSALFRHLPRD
jgi:hypothetical protein